MDLQVPYKTNVVLQVGYDANGPDPAVLQGWASTTPSLRTLDLHGNRETMTDDRILMVSAQVSGGPGSAAR